MFICVQNICRFLCKHLYFWKWKACLCDFKMNLKAFLVTKVWHLIVLDESQLNFMDSSENFQNNECVHFLPTERLTITECCREMWMNLTVRKRKKLKVHLTKQGKDILKGKSSFVKAQRIATDQECKIWLGKKMDDKIEVLRDYFA